MAIAGETAVYGSFISVANQLLLLGNSYIVLLAVVPVQLLKKFDGLTCIMPRKSLFWINFSGRSSFHVLVIRAWNERLDYLVKNNQYLDCLALGIEFYQVSQLQNNFMVNTYQKLSQSLFRVLSKSLWSWKYKYLYIVGFSNSS